MDKKITAVFENGKVLHVYKCFDDFFEWWVGPSEEKKPLVCPMCEKENIKLIGLKLWGNGGHIIVER